MGERFCARFEVKTQDSRKPHFRERGKLEQGVENRRSGFVRNFTRHGFLLSKALVILSTDNIDIDIDMDIQEKKGKKSWQLIEFLIDSKDFPGIWSPYLLDVAGKS